MIKATFTKGVGQDSEKGHSEADLRDQEQGEK
jgi:hypothetical protein